MGMEIERKFIVRNTSWKNGAKGIRYRQGYLTMDPERTVRVRVAADKGYLTIKGRGSGIVRPEFEYEISHGDATTLLDFLCLRPLIEKDRYRIEHGGFIWEVDEFLGANRGLVLAEVELVHADQTFPIPHWAGEEVSGDPRYFNASLVKNPWIEWQD